MAPTPARRGRSAPGDSWTNGALTRFHDRWDAINALVLADSQSVHEAGRILRVAVGTVADGPCVDLNSEDVLWRLVWPRSRRARRGALVTAERVADGPVLLVAAALPFVFRERDPSAPAASARTACPATPTPSTTTRCAWR